LKELKNKRHETFCHEYLKDLNATRAYKDVYKTKNQRTAESAAQRLLSNVEVQRRVQELMDERSERVKIDADYVLNTIQEVAERCMQRAPVMVRLGKEMVQAIDEEGRHVWRFDSSGANKSLELLGKHLKLFTEKFEHSGSVDLSSLSDEKINELLKQYLNNEPPTKN
tara:strand:- start:24602 stop:25105 length:504 start_codon:yes stop_codon:yes gene_type:complete